jgi:toxin YoeB
MKIIFHPRAWEDYCYWQQSERQLLKRVNELVKAIQRQPFEGIGKPGAFALRVERLLESPH